MQLKVLPITFRVFYFRKAILASTGVALIFGAWSRLQSSAEFTYHFYESGMVVNIWVVEMICQHKQVCLFFFVSSLDRSKI